MRNALLFLVALAMPAAATGHHGWSSYDTDMKWKGATWNVVLAPVSRMEARGLTPAMIAPGKAVRLVGYARKDGTREMRIERITAGGKTVELR